MTDAQHPDGDSRPDDPLARLREWLPHDDERPRPTASLATVARDGAPTVRTVLLAAVTADGGPVFTTDARSDKVAQLDADPRVSLVLTWAERARQVVVDGVAHRLDRAAETALFGTRSRYLRLLAWSGRPDGVVDDRAERRARWARFDREHPDATLTVPDTWRAYAVRPERIVFWHGESDGPCTRWDCRRDPVPDGRARAAWTVEHRPG